MWGIRTLRQLHTWLTGTAQLDDRIDTPSSAPEPSVDLADVIGRSMPGSQSRSPPPAPIT